VDSGAKRGDGERKRPRLLFLAPSPEIGWSGGGTLVFAPSSARVPRAGRLGIKAGNDSVVEEFRQNHLWQNHFSEEKRLIDDFGLLILDC